MLARSGKFEAAIQGFKLAQKWNPSLDPDILIPTWYSICWQGSTVGQASLVLSACNEAVTRAPENAEIRDSRGLARALTGDIRGAIADFQFFIQWLDRTKPDNAGDRKAQRQGWIDALQAGKPPSAIFTPAVLEEL